MKVSIFSAGASASVLLLGVSLQASALDFPPAPAATPPIAGGYFQQPDGTPPSNGVNSESGTEPPAVDPDEDDDTSDDFEDPYSDEPEP